MSTPEETAQWVHRYCDEIEHALGADYAALDPDTSQAAAIRIISAGLGILRASPTAKLQASTLRCFYCYALFGGNRAHILTRTDTGERFPVHLRCLERIKNTLDGGPPFPPEIPAWLAGNAFRLSGSI